MALMVIFRWEGSLNMARSVKNTHSDCSGVHFEGSHVNCLSCARTDNAAKYVGSKQPILKLPKSYTDVALRLLATFNSPLTSFFFLRYTCIFSVSFAFPLICLLPARTQDRTLILLEEHVYIHAAHIILERCTHRGLAYLRS